VSGASGVFGGENNKVLIMTTKGKESWPWLTKQEVARRLVARLAAMLAETGR
jgi:phosphopantothenoylcysteine decarboxylase/phosphopantothenate--cysteine ligase